jgi:tetratricopeptide (TPR) repeat protein
MISAALQGVMDSSVAYPCAQEALRRSTQLDADNVDARCAAAWLNLVYERKLRQARVKFEEVLGKLTRRSFALSGLALLHIAEGDPAGASTWAWEAWRQNPLIGSLGALVCWSQYLAGDWEQTLELVSQVHSSGGCGATIASMEALALIQAGSTPVHLQRMEAIAGEFPQNQTLQGALGYAYANAGHPERAREILHAQGQLNAQRQRHHAYGLALNALGLGKEQEALRWMEISYAEGSFWSLGFRFDPLLRQLSSNPRFEMLVRKIGPGVGVASQPVAALELLAEAV